MEEVKFTGKSFSTEVWKNQMTKRMYTVIKNRVFKIGNWDGSPAVLTAKGEWICDTDCEFFKKNFTHLQ